MANSSIKERLLSEIEKLPQMELREVLDFARYLRRNRNQLKLTPGRGKLDIRKDPILKLIGIVDVEPFAGAIDAELYGRA